MSLWDLDEATLGLHPKGLTSVCVTREGEAPTLRRCEDPLSRDQTWIMPSKV